MNILAMAFQVLSLMDGQPSKWSMVSSGVSVPYRYRVGIGAQAMP